MVKKLFKQLIGWGISVAIGFFIVNLLCFGYFRLPIWINTANGATIAYREPYSFMLNAKEGFSISRIDRNGYSNPDKELSDSYILMLGASHTVGKEIAPDKKYPVIVSDYLAQDEYLHAYSIALDGCFLPSEIKYFNASITAFTNSDTIVIEISNTDCSTDELKDALNQVEYNPKQSALTFKDMHKKDLLLKKLRCDMPLYQLIQTNMETIRKVKSESTETDINLTEYKKLMNRALSLIRSEYNKPIVFVYHPGVTIENDGSISLKYSRTIDCFKELCENNGIDFIDSGDDFLDYYERYHKVPYGFWNTTLGNGHLNAVGHEILANEIIAYLEGKQE